MALKEWSTEGLDYADLNSNFLLVFGSGNIFISPLFYKANSSWSTRTQSSGAFFGGSLDAGGSDAAYVTYDVTLQPGTYRIDICGMVGTDFGISDIYIDGVEKASIDWYNGSGLDDQFKNATDITVDSEGTVELKFLIDGKNGSSSSYKCRLQAIQITRTGD